MWGSKDKSKMAKVDTLIGEGTSVAGDVTCNGGLHVDGIVRGNIIADGGDSAAMLVVGEHGRVEGEIRVPHVIISGVVMGDVRALESVELSPRSQVTGNIYYTRIEMAMGAEVNGQLIHVTQEKARALPSPEENEGLTQVTRKLEKFHVVDRQS
jgi:cytoskeletal protein CcmA (bactofilin family)